MLSTCSFGPRPSHLFSSTVNIATRTLFGAALGVVVLCLATTIPLHASGSISLGTIQVQNTPGYLRQFVVLL